MNCRSAVTFCLGALVWLVGCAQPLPAPADLQGLLPTPLLLLGEQHDAAEHQRLQRQTLAQLAAPEQLAALVLEMVERGHQTTGLPRDASETQVRTALDWSAERNAGAWPWATYGPLVMDAVRAGVPVLGGNLPRTQMRTVMAENALDTVLGADALREQQDQMREGHCNLLPPSQIAPMTRIQLARDRALAQTALAAQQPGKTVLLVAGNQHVRRDLGVPRHLPAGQAHRVVMALAGASAEAGDTTLADRSWITAPVPPQDHCADLQQQMGPRPAAKAP